MKAVNVRYARFGSVILVWYGNPAVTFTSLVIISHIQPQYTSATSMSSGGALIPDYPVSCQFGTSAGAEVDHRQRKKRIIEENIQKSLD